MYTLRTLPILALAVAFLAASAAGCMGPSARAYKAEQIAQEKAVSDEYERDALNSSMCMDTMNIEEASCSDESFDRSCCAAWPSDEEGILDRDALIAPSDDDRDLFAEERDLNKDLTAVVEETDKAECDECAGCPAPDSDEYLLPHPDRDINE